MNEMQRAGIIGVFFLLIGSGGTLILDQGELEHAYICDQTGELGIFYGGISGTGLTGYPDRDSRAGYERCYHPVSGDKGEWIACDDYARQHGKTCAEAVDEGSGYGPDVVLRQEINDRFGNKQKVVCFEEEYISAQ